MLRANDDVAIAYRVFGQGSINLVCVRDFISYCTGIGSFRFRRLLTGPGSFARVAIVDRRGVGLSDRLSPQDLRLVTFNASGHLYWVDDNGVATSPVIS